MKKRDLIRGLKELQGVSGGEDVCLKSPAGGQWEELVLRRATGEEKQVAGIAPDRWVAVIAADGDEKLTLETLLAQLRRLPETAEVYVMHYPDTGPERPSDLVVLGPKLLSGDAQTRRVIALSA